MSEKPKNVGKQTIDQLAKKYEEENKKINNTGLEIAQQIGNIAGEIKKSGKFDPKKIQEYTGKIKDHVVKTYGLKSEDDNYWLEKGIGFNESMVLKNILEGQVEGIKTGKTIGNIVSDESFQQGQNDFKSYKIQSSVNPEDVYKPEVFKELGLNNVDPNKAPEVIGITDMANFAYIKQQGEDMSQIEKSLLNQPQTRLALKDSYVSKNLKQKGK